MRFTSISAIAAGFLLALTGAGLAQGVVTGQEIQVNPLPPGGGVLLYPGGEYSRTVPPLLYPGDSGGPIRLHMPTRHHVAAAEPEPAREAEAAPKPEAKPRRVASAAPKPARQPEPQPASAPAPAPAPGPQASLNPFG